MKKIIINEIEYDLIKNHKDGFDIKEVTEKMTEYFEPYDYVLGDWSYGKLRLKGFCDKKNKLINNINDYKKVDEYLKEHCSFDCKHFILKKSQDLN
ncbi:MAG: DUF1027 domain-containing protein [Bacilli bacterium]|nr:DUF1027 domain-containing protein [Bacilli bacterium]MDD4809286.1 DUF1027 domain-containing protein [Bacilli bacterium]